MEPSLPSSIVLGFAQIPLNLFSVRHGKSRRKKISQHLVFGFVFYLIRCSSGYKFIFLRGFVSRICIQATPVVPHCTFKFIQFRVIPTLSSKIQVSWFPSVCLLMGIWAWHTMKFTRLYHGQAVIYLFLTFLQQTILWFAFCLPYLIHNLYMYKCLKVEIKDQISLFPQHSEPAIFTSTFFLTEQYGKGYNCQAIGCWFAVTSTTST